MTNPESNRPTPPANSVAVDPEWRIDELARRAQTSVDTIRYYQRERLLSPGARQGRVNLYGPNHLKRLQKIQELQERRFSLAAIKALLTEERKGLVEGIFADDTLSAYSFADLIKEADISLELAESLQAVGFLRKPNEFGKDAYDDDDLEVLRTLAKLKKIGFPTTVIVEMARLYGQGITATQKNVIRLFSTGGDLEWEQDDLSEFQNLAREKSLEVLPLARQLVDYTHHRTIQRLTLSVLTDPKE